MKPITATRGNCDHCETVQVKNLAGKDVTRYKCDLTESTLTYSKPCTMYDWAKCTYNEDK